MKRFVLMLVTVLSMGLLTAPANAVNITSPVCTTHPKFDYGVTHEEHKDTVYVNLVGSLPPCRWEQFVAYYFMPGYPMNTGVLNFGPTDFPNIHKSLVATGFPCGTYSLYLTLRSKVLAGGSNTRCAK